MKPNINHFKNELVLLLYTKAYQISSEIDQEDMTIPVIDFSKLEGDERDQTLAEIANGFEEWGFFQLRNTGIAEELLERVKRVCAECYKEREEAFRKSDSVKELERAAAAAAEGEGLAVKRIGDMDWEDVFTLHGADAHWPSNPPAFKETMKEFRGELQNLAEKILVIMEECLGLEKGYIKRAFSKDGVYEPFFGTKVLKNGRWIDVQPVENAIVINTGDQIEVLTNGRYKSAWHRILATRDGNRRSIASFYNPSPKATIAPAAAAAADYPEFMFGDYMEVYAKQKFQAKEPRFAAMATNK